VFVPDLPIPAGARQLTLEAHNPDGTVTRSPNPVILVVPSRMGEPAIAVDAKPGGAKLMQGPAAATDAGTLTIDMIDHDQAGGLFVAGRAGPGASVQVYLDNKLVGRGFAGQDGGWTLKAKPPAAGRHTLRADQLGPKGDVVARVEVPYETGVDMVTAAPGTVVVRPGISLWRIARQIYGNGPAFTVIYRANKDNIRDPNLIYPGQVFALPQR
jgi:nucleoid-associated protein YgaU